LDPHLSRLVVLGSFHLDPAAWSDVGRFPRQALESRWVSIKSSDSLAGHRDDYDRTHPSDSAEGGQSPKWCSAGMNSLRRMDQRFWRASLRMDGDEFRVLPIKLKPLCAGAGGSSANFDHPVDNGALHGCRAFLSLERKLVGCGRRGGGRVEVPR